MQIRSSPKELFSSSRLKGILFDLDGVLADTMRLHDAAWRRAVQPLGLELPKEEIYLREGEKGVVTAHDMLVKAGREPRSEAIQKLLKEKEKFFKQSSKIEPFPGVRDCLEKLRKQFRLGLVTGSYLEEVKAILDSDDLNLFEVVVTADSVEKGKPDPEPYLLALKKLALQADEALVIENAPYGIQAAHRAGLACIALTTSLPVQYLSMADLILTGLDEVVELFGGKGTEKAIN